jgi:hypothetical protein
VDEKILCRIRIRREKLMAITNPTGMLRERDLVSGAEESRSVSSDWIWRELLDTYELAVEDVPIRLLRDVEFLGRVPNKVKVKEGSKVKCKIKAK